MRRFTITVERVRRLVRGRNLVLLVLVVLAAAGSGLWFYLRWGTGLAEPMCLVMTRQDVRPLVGEAVSVSDDRGGPIPSPEPGYWTCSVHGESASIRVEATPDADERLSNYKDPETPVLQTLTTRRGATSQPIPGTAGAVVVSWTQDGSVHAGWFEAGSAVVVSMDISDDAAATARLGDLAHLLKRRAPPAAGRHWFHPAQPAAEPRHDRCADPCGLAHRHRDHDPASVETPARSQEKIVVECTRARRTNHERPGSRLSGLVE